MSFDHFQFRTYRDRKRILVTGGASVNTAILQVVADVFNTRVFTMVSVW